MIVGNIVDSDYIFWLSFTKTTDKELNELIFNHVANDAPERVSYLYKVLKYNEIPYEILEDYYRVQLKRVPVGEMAWDTPFGHYYGKSQIENNGKFFAKDVSLYVAGLHRMCEIREAGGIYEEVLRSYLTFLQKEENYTPAVRKLEEILKAEEYLYLSGNEPVRQLYKRCRKLCSTLYNEYMTKAR